jgi:prepilin-type N-terminal cleavage/methylation domain-containing protein
MRAAVRIVPLTAQSGYSLVELMVVIVLMTIAAGIAVPLSSQMLSVSRADSATVAALTAVDMAHDRAVAERRNIEMTFVNPNRIQLERQEVPGPGKTLIAEYFLENGQQFLKFSGVPDTPDAFGASSAITFSGTAPFMFTSDGSLVDSNGDVVNGTIFIGKPGDTKTARAITVFGVTGLSHAWKWRGGSWME